MDVYDIYNTSSNMATPSRVTLKRWQTELEDWIMFFCNDHGEMGFAVRVRSAGQKYGPTCHQRDRADVTEFVTLVRLSSLGQHVGVLALAGYKQRKSALTVGPIATAYCNICPTFSDRLRCLRNLSAALIDGVCGVHLKTDQLRKTCPK